MQSVLFELIQFLHCTLFLSAVQHQDHSFPTVLPVTVNSSDTACPFTAIVEGVCCPYVRPNYILSRPLHRGSTCYATIRFFTKGANLIPSQAIILIGLPFLRILQTLCRMRGGFFFCRSEDAHQDPIETFLNCQPTTPNWS